MKLIEQQYILPLKLVAPFAGAWIEITCARLLAVIGMVAPFAGAWIEIISKGKRY